MSCAGAVLWMSQAGRPGTSVRRNASPESPVSCPDTRGAAGDRDPAATHLSAFSEVMRPLPVHVFRSHAGRPLRPFREARRREPAVVCQQPPVVRSTQFGGRRRSRPRGRRDYRNRGEAIAALAVPGGPKRACRRSSPTIAIRASPAAKLQTSRHRNVAEGLVWIVGRQRAEAIVPVGPCAGRLRQPRLCMRPVGDTYARPGHISRCRSRPTSLPLANGRCATDARAETRFHFRTGITSVVPWLVASGSSSLDRAVLI